MRDIDPQLMRLREVEAKIVLVGVRLEETEELMQALDRESVLRPVHEQHRRAFLETMDVLRQHREVLLKLMHPFVPRT